MSATHRSDAEWLETDALGGFAMGRVDLLRTRRYHALLVAARRPPGDRVVLVHGFDATLERPTGTHALVRQRYAPDVVAPAASLAIADFDAEPWPRWTYALPGGGELVQELWMPHDVPAVAVTWRLRGAPAGPARLTIRPFLSGRAPHETHHENATLRFDADVRESGTAGDVVWRPYATVPAIRARSNGRYRHAPEWYRRFEYDEERARGLDFEEDLASPGELTFDLAAGEAFVVFQAEVEGRVPSTRMAAERQLDRWRAGERSRRGRFATPLHRAGDAYVVERGAGRTIVAGYPWFGDWGRDTFIALRGLCLAADRWGDARDILLEWAPRVKDGLLPNFLDDAAREPAYNAVDASLWFVVAVHELLAAAASAHEARPLVTAESLALDEAVLRIVEGYARGTRFGIRMDDDALLAAGEPGWQLTWMDARADGREVTPRIGKPVEVQALWINALRIAGAIDARWRAVADRAQRAFADRFWSDDVGHLADVADVNHARGAMDWTLRPNQLFAVGGLPWAVLDGERARRVVEVVERVLWTPAGPRTLAPGDPAYRPRYEGGVAARDGAYHQGAAWPWLAGAFVEAWVRVRGAGDAVRAEAERRFVAPLVRHYAEFGIGHVGELADAEPPHTPRGAPFQAWSVGEALRLTMRLGSPDGWEGAPGDAALEDAAQLQGSP